MTLRRTILAFVISGLISAPLFAQKVQPTVATHTDRLSQEERDYVVNLGDELTNTMSAYQWTTGKYRYALPLQVDIYFDKYVRVGSVHRYTAGILVALKSGIQIRDKRWDFQYSQDYRLHLGEPYDTFTGMVEFCVNLCLGFEADRMSPLGGDAYYRKAQQIGELARSEALFASGWDDRREFAFSMTDTAFSNIRLAHFHSEAGAFFANKNNWEQAEGHLRKTIELLLATQPSRAEYRRGDYIVRFVDLDALATTLQRAKLDRELDALAEWDTENAARYQR